MSEATIDLLKIAGPIVAVLLGGFGWFIKRGFDLRSRDREFVVGVVKEGLHFLNVLESSLTQSLWFQERCPDKEAAARDLQARHLLVDMGATKYKEVLVEAQARLPPRVYRALHLPIGRWSLTRMLQSGYDQMYRADGANPDQWLQIFRTGVWDDVEYQRNLLAKVSRRY